MYRACKPDRLLLLMLTGQDAAGAAGCGRDVHGALSRCTNTALLVVCVAFVDGDKYV